MTFKEYMLQKGLSKSTADTYQKQLYYFVNWCQDQNIEPETATYNEVLGFMQELQKRQNIQATVSTYVNSLKHYFSWVMDRGFREHNPVHHIKIRGIKRKHLYHIIPMRELGQLYEKYPVMQKNKDMENQNWYRQSILTSNRNKVMLGLLIWQGITSHELQKITIHDLKIREGKIHIPSARRSNERELKLESMQILELMEYTKQIRPQLQQQRTTPTDLLFISKTNGASLQNSITLMMKKIEQLNPQIKSLKQIRASVITHWLKGHNLRQVQYMAGHRYVSSTESYLINDLEGLQEDIEKYHPIG